MAVQMQPQQQWQDMEAEGEGGVGECTHFGFCLAWLLRGHIAEETCQAVLEPSKFHSKNFF